MTSKTPILDKTRYINGNNFNSFHRKSKYTLSYASMRRQGCLSLISHRQDNTISVMIIKTTTTTCKNQKLNRKLREENVEAI